MFKPVGSSLVGISLHDLVPPSYQCSAAHRGLKAYKSETLIGKDTKSVSYYTWSVFLHWLLNVHNSASPTATAQV